MRLLHHNTVNCTGYKVLNYLSWDPQIESNTISNGCGFIICSPDKPAKIDDRDNLSQLYGVTGLIENENIKKTYYGIQLDMSDVNKALPIFSLACGLSITEKVGLEIGDTVVVAGANALALRIIEAAILQGAKTVCLLQDSDTESIYFPMIQKNTDKVITFQLNASFESEFEALGKSTLGKTIYIDASGIPALIHYMATRLKMFDGMILCRQDSTGYFPLDIYRDIHRKSARIYYWYPLESSFNGTRMIDLCQRAAKLYECNRVLNFV